MARFADGRIGAERETVVKWLVGNYPFEHLFTLRQSLEAYRHYQKMLLDCDREIEQRMGRFAQPTQRRPTVAGP